MSPQYETHVIIGMLATAIDERLKGQFNIGSLLWGANDCPQRLPGVLQQQERAVIRTGTERAN
jgi:hypothetical protein